MKSYREELTFETQTRRAYINITPQVEAALKKSGIKEGLCLVNPMHISASVYINDDEPGLLKDYDDFLERLVPHEPIDQYRHNDTGEDNADAHIKRQVMGREVVVAITNGKLDFGPWEQIFYGELDGGPDAKKWRTYVATKNHDCCIGTRRRDGGDAAGFLGAGPARPGARAW